MWKIAATVGVALLVVGGVMVSEDRGVGIAALVIGGLISLGAFAAAKPSA